jgi:hypothetical protein
MLDSKDEARLREPVMFPGVSPIPRLGVKPQIVAKPFFSAPSMLVFASKRAGADDQ